MNVHTALKVLAMKRSLLCTICLLSTAILPIDGLWARIFGGTDAPEGKLPYFAYLSAKAKIEGKTSSTYCGGSIIDKRWILTAGHCFRRFDARDIEVILGTVFRTAPPAMVYRVEKFIIHEAFDHIMLYYDIALLRVDRDIQFNDRVQPIPLADRNTPTGENENVRFSGFGRIEDHSRTERLKTVVLKMYGYHRCKQLEPAFTETLICTIPTGGKGPCIGDSGGPLVNENGIQIGIDSHSHGMGLKTCGIFPEFYTRVSSVREWIDEKIRHN